MQFTPGQLRGTVGISVETFRHWKRVLPPFTRRKRYTPSFTVGDLLAASILRRLTEGCGVRVGHLIRLSNEIVSICNLAGWASLEQKVLFIDLEKNTCQLAGPNDDSGPEDVVVRCPLGPIMREVRDGLTRSLPPTKQRNFLFPPVEVEVERKARGRAS